MLRSRLRDIVWSRELELGRRISQIEIAEATGLSANTISRWMSPKPLEQIRRETVVPLCEYFHVDIGDLVTIVHQPETSQSE